MERRAVFCLGSIHKIYITYFLYCQRCKVDKNVSTQDEFELAPLKKVVTPKVRTVKAKKIEKVQFSILSCKVKSVKAKKGKKKKKDNQRKERKATQTLAIVLGTKKTNINTNTKTNTKTNAKANEKTNTTTNTKTKLETKRPISVRKPKQVSR